MNFKRLSTAALALALTASLVPASLAAERPEGWTPADGARGPVLISSNPNAESYNKVITINGEALESYDYDREVPGWGSETVSVQLSEIPNAPAGYIPLRAVLQADGGSAYWNAEDYTSSFYYEKEQIVTNFNDMTISVNDEKVEGEALLIEGVTYVPAAVLNLLTGVTVTDNSTDEGESYAIATPNGAPLMKLAASILETADMGRGMKSSPAELVEYYGETHGFTSEQITEGVAFLPMMTSPDTLVLGKLGEGQEESLKAAFESYRKQQEDTFSWYLSQNLPKVENAQFVTEGEWFLFLIGENAEEAVKVFQEGVKTLEEAQ